MKKSFTVLPAVIVAATLLLSGCAATPTPAASSSASIDPAATSETDAAETDADTRSADQRAIALTCAAYSLIVTNQMNATADLAAGTITPDQYAAIIGTVVTNIRALSIREGFGLRDDIAAISDYIGTAPAVPFDIADARFAELQQVVIGGCAANGSEIVAYGTTGG